MAADEDWYGLGLAGLLDVNRLGPVPEESYHQ